MLINVKSFWWYICDKKPVQWIIITVWRHAHTIRQTVRERERNSLVTEEALFGMRNTYSPIWFNDRHRVFCTPCLWKINESYPNVMKYLSPHRQLDMHCMTLLTFLLCVRVCNGLSLTVWLYVVMIVCCELHFILVSLTRARGGAPSGCKKSITQSDTERLQLENTSDNTLKHITFKGLTARPHLGLSHLNFSLDIILMLYFM